LQVVARSAESKVTDENAVVRQLAGLAEEVLAPLKRPARFVVVDWGLIPLTTTNKVKRKELAQVLVTLSASKL
jgi:acyl-CoA synthetase (AMP-forming)/AMP-acid ligase II